MERAEKKKHCSEGELDDLHGLTSKTGISAVECSGYFRRMIILRTSTINGDLASSLSLIIQSQHVGKGYFWCICIVIILKVNYICTFRNSIISFLNYPLYLYLRCSIRLIYKHVFLHTKTSWTR